MSDSEVFRDRSSDYDVFELVTDALEFIDKYNKSKDEKLLEPAYTHLKHALEINRGHFRARYFQAMVNYLQGNKYREAIEQFDQLLHGVGLSPALANEIRYNLAATYCEVRNWTMAIDLFSTTISNTRDNPELNLLARVGLVKTHAEAKYSDEAEPLAELISQKIINAHYTEIHRLLSPNPFRWLLNRISRKKRIDREVKVQVKKLVADAATKEGLKFRRPLWLKIIIGIIFFFLVAALIYTSCGVRLQ
jgi:tetratricopeptide (TPR) repeat protein